MLAIAAALGPGLIITALTVRYRDFRMIIPFIVQFGLYVCPVAYSSDVIHDKLVEKLGAGLGTKLFLLYSLNPMVGVIDGFRWAILGNVARFLLAGVCLVGRSLRWRCCCRHSLFSQNRTRVCGRYLDHV